MFLYNMAIAKNAKHPDKAHKFINYILRPKVHAKITEAVKYANSNKASLKFTDVAMTNDRSLFLTGAVLLVNCARGGRKHY